MYSLSITISLLKMALFNNKINDKFVHYVGGDPNLGSESVQPIVGPVMRNLRFCFGVCWVQKWCFFIFGSPRLKKKTPGKLIFNIFQKMVFLFSPTSPLQSKGCGQGATIFQVGFQGSKFNYIFLVWGCSREVCLYHVLYFFLEGLTNVFGCLMFKYMTNHL